MKLFLKDTKRPGWKLYFPIAKVLMYIPAKYLFWNLVILREMYVFVKVNTFYTNFDIAINENQMTGDCDHGNSVIQFISHFRKVQQTCVAITE